MGSETRNKNRIEEEPRSRVVDASPRRINPESDRDLTRKGFSQMTDKEVERMISEAQTGMGEPMSNKGAMKADMTAHLSEHVGFEAEPDTE